MGGYGYRYGMGGYRVPPIFYSQTLLSICSNSHLIVVVDYCYYVNLGNLALHPSCMKNN